LNIKLFGVRGDNTYIAPQRRPVRRQAQRQRADVPEAHPV